MNKNNSDIPISGDLKNVPKPKPINPAVLGMPSSHGVKLPVNMTSASQKELLLKLQEWRKARREKLAASIFAKQKQIEKSQTQIPVRIQKSKPASVKHDESLSIKNTQTVFERLYKNSGKTKKTEDTMSCSKSLQTSPHRTPAVLSFEKPIKPVKLSLVEKEKTESLQRIIDNEKGPDYEKISIENDNDDDLSEDTMKSETPLDADNSVKENFCETIKAVKPDLKSDLICNDSLKAVKNDLAFKSLPFKVSSKVAKTEGKKKPLRRSISMMFREKSKIDTGIRRSISVKNLNDKKTINEVSTKAVFFATPKSSAPSSSSVNLRTKLENWLKMNGHSLEEYRHLRCFSIANNYKPIPKFSDFHPEGFLENSNYVTAPNTPMEDSNKENVTPSTVMKQMDEKDVKNWLNELHHLIVELKYPSDRCEEWLAAIRKKCPNCSQLPIYWECLAALHESKGDLGSAIEDYERAIIKGGEVDAVGNSLAELFDKLVIEQKKNSKHKLEKGLDPKNIFKSTIIKFALQQKALKKLNSEIEPSVRQQLYIATPVRRSSRIQTPFKLTEVNSLQTLTPDFLKNVKFKPNKSLLSEE